MTNITKPDLIAVIDALANNGSIDDSDIRYLMNYLIADGEPNGTTRDMIQIRRGNYSDLPLLGQGELAFTLDTKQLFVGGSSGNVNLLDFDKQMGVNPANYGAVGGGVVDDSDAFIEAFAAPINNNGTKITIPPGIYMISKPIDLLYDNVSIEGYGAVILISPNVSASVNAIFRATNKKNIKVKGLTIDGNGANQSGNKNTFMMFFDRCSDVTVSECTFREGYGDMLVFHNNIRPKAINNNFIKTYSSNTRDFMGMLNYCDNVAYRSNYGIFTGNHFIDITFDALVVSGQEGATKMQYCIVANNEFTNCGHMQFDSITPEQDAASIYIQDIENVQVTGNQVDRTWGNGIDLLRASNVNIESNFVSHSGNAGISVEMGENTSIVGNHIFSNVTKGETSLNVQHGLLAGITLKSPYNNVNIVGNNIYDDQQVKTQKYAIYMRGGDLSNIQIGQNYLKGNIATNPIFWEELDTTYRIVDNLGYNPLSYGINTPVIPGLTVGERNLWPFPVTVYMNGGSGVGVQSIDGVNHVLPGNPQTVVLQPFEFIYFTTAVPSSWLWCGN